MARITSLALSTTHLASTSLDMHMYVYSLEAILHACHVRNIPVHHYLPQSHASCEGHRHIGFPTISILWLRTSVVCVPSIVWPWWLFSFLVPTFFAVFQVPLNPVDYETDSTTHMSMKCCIQRHKKISMTSVYMWFYQSTDLRLGKRLSSPYQTHKADHSPEHRIHRTNDGDSVCVHVLEWIDVGQCVHEHSQQLLTSKKREKGYISFFGRMQGISSEAHVSHRVCAFWMSKPRCTDFTSVWTDPAWSEMFVLMMAGKWKEKCMIQGRPPSPLQGLQ